MSERCFLNPFLKSLARSNYHSLITFLQPIVEWFMELETLQMVFVVKQSALGRGDLPLPVQINQELGDPSVGGYAAILPVVTGHLTLVVSHHHHVELLDEAAMGRDQHSPHWLIITLHHPLSKVSQECPDSVPELKENLKERETN